jgi:hypothetical protein
VIDLKQQLTSTQTQLVQSEQVVAEQLTQLQQLKDRHAKSLGKVESKLDNLQHKA